LSVAIVCLIMWMIFHYFLVGQSDSARVSSLNPTELLKEVSVENIESYHETQVFRDIILLFLYIIFGFFGLTIYMTPCHRCNTPYPLLAIGIMVTYAIRALVKAYNLPFFYHRFNILAREVFNYQLYFDERRLQQDSVKDVYMTGSWNIAALIDLFFFMCSIILASLGTVWVSNNECAVRCIRLFHYSKYLLGGMYVLEGFYCMTVLILRYYQRVLGVERVLDIFRRLRTQYFPSHPASKPLTLKVK